MGLECSLTTRRTGLHYNYFRDYDPAIGRYVQSDPIGLDGGMNTYGYGEASPIMNSDEQGLSVFKAIKWVIQGGKKIGWIPGSTISAKTALHMRKAGKSVCVEGKKPSDVYRDAVRIEAKAHDGKIIHHPKDSHVRGGNQPHVQTRGVKGHTFYKFLGALAATTYLGDGLLGEAIDLVNPLSIGKDLADLYVDLAGDDCSCYAD